MEQTRSKFEFYSWAIAAQNKHLDTDELYATPIEVTPYMDGELDARIEDVEGSGEDHNEEAYTVVVKKDNAVLATWLPMHNTNRRTSPDVRRGERIMLYRMADSDRFYWVSLGMDDYLRRLETVIYTWSATDREEDDATDPEFCYSLEVCTHTRQVTFRTVKGIDHGGKGTTEPFAYTLQFNTDYGSVVLTDDAGNYFQLDSPETCLTFENKDGTYTHWDKKDIHMYAPNEITMKAENRIFMECGNSTIEMTPSNITQISPQIDLNP